MGMFSLMDADKSGKIDSNELTHLLSLAGFPNVTEDMAVKVIYDLNNSTFQGCTELAKSTFVESMVSGRMARVASIHLEDGNMERTNNPKMGEKTQRRKSRRRLSRANSILHNEDKLITWACNEKHMSTSFSMMLQILVVIHTPISRKVFQYFVCHRLGDTIYLLTDFRVVCGSSRYYAFLPLVF